MSWNQGFATDYQERGNMSSSQSYPSYQNPVYPSSPTSKGPSYNRSPAPFHSVQGQAYPDPALNGYPASHQQVLNPPPYQLHPSASPSQNLDAQVIDKREQPEMDEDFPSYKDLRNVFLQKQQEAELEERKASTLPRRQFGRTGFQTSQSVQKPPPTPAKKPASLVSPGAQGKNRVITQTSSHYQQSQEPQTPPTSRSMVQITSQARSNYPGQQQAPVSYQSSPASTYTEIPVQHITKTTERTQVFETQQPHLRRTDMGYRPPMSINVSSPYTDPSYDGASPRVKITSNSPMSPQRAWYRPDDTDSLIIPRQTDRRHSVSFAPMMMSSSANQPRRRTSYAEIFIGSTPQSPMARDLSASSPGLVQRSFTQVTTNRVVNGVPDTQDESFPSFRELKSQFSRQESNDISRRQQVDPFGVTFSSRQNQQPNGNFTRVNLRRSSQQNNAQPEIMQRQAPGWSATVQTGSGGSQPVIRAGPNVHYVPSARQPGKTAAHLQYNSPMGLYSASNAQEALDRDPEAAELLKLVGVDLETGRLKRVGILHNEWRIKGPQSSYTLINSPTLRAVLKEDSIKCQTGRKADIGYYHNHREYGPGIGPLRQYEEVPDTLCQTITEYNQNQDKSLTYPMWCAL